MGHWMPYPFKSRSLPAIWKAVVEGGQIREWHVHEDTPEGRRRIGHDPGSPETGMT